MKLCTDQAVFKLLPALASTEEAAACVSAAVENASTYCIAKLARLQGFKLAEPVPGIVQLACSFLAAAYVINMQFSGGQENEQMQLSAYYEKEANDLLSGILDGSLPLLDAAGEAIQPDPAAIEPGRPLLIYGKRCELSEAERKERSGCRLW
jgi:hypothetical protein